MKIIRKYINENIYFKPDIETYTEAIYKNPVKKIVAYNRERKEPEYVQETEFQRMEKQRPPWRQERGKYVRIKTRSA